MIADGLFVDGGVIGRNPSGVGGTWAARLMQGGEEAWSMSGVITPIVAGMPTITNNLTEMLALLRGLERLQADWVGTVYSDSQITLGRAFQGWKWSEIPQWMHQSYQKSRARLVRWDAIAWVLLDGHPTREQLERGIGKRGHLVSEHNVWCDQACQKMAKQYLKCLAEVQEIEKTATPVTEF